MDKEGKIGILVLIAWISTALIFIPFLNRISDDDLTDFTNMKSVLLCLGVYVVFIILSFILVKSFI